MQLCNLKKINYTLKKEGLPVLKDGLDNLRAVGLEDELITLLVTLQEAFTFPILLHWNQKEQRYDINFFGNRFTEDLPRSALQIFAISQGEKAAEQKWLLIQATENVLD